MRNRRTSCNALPACVSALLLGCLLAGPAAAKPNPPPPHWVGTWMTAPVDEPNANALFSAAGGTTLRELVHTTLGGSLLRVTLSNRFGVQPLTVESTHVALATGAGAGPTAGEALASANALTFGGQEVVTIPPGAEVTSDPFALTLPEPATLAVSFFIPAQTLSHLTSHPGSYQTSFRAAGDVVGKANLGSATQTMSWYFLTGVDVQAAPADAAAVVTLGDSITAGTHSTPNLNHRWPDFFAARLAHEGKTKQLGVLNAGIGGNRILQDGAGASALARFDRDVLAHAGVHYVVLLEGINDIGHATGPDSAAEPLTAGQLIQGLSEMASRAHTHGLVVYGATILPYSGAKYYSQTGETIRKAVNQWIRTTNVLDGFIDFDKAMSDPAHPGTLRAEFDSGDHLHPSDAGYKAMGDAVPLELFNPHPKEKYDIKLAH